MKYSFASLAFALAALATAATQAIAGSPSVVGTWAVSFFLESTRSTGATQCIVYTLASGTVAGVPSSGTWTSPSFAGWSGQWIQLGDHVRWFGITGGLATSESGNMENRANMGGVSFNHFSTSDATTSTAGSWIARRVATCPAGAKSAGGDPAH